MSKGTPSRSCFAAHPSSEAGPQIKNILSERSPPIFSLIISAERPYPDNNLCFFAISLFKKMRKTTVHALPSLRPELLFKSSYGFFQLFIQFFLTLFILRQNFGSEGHFPSNVKLVRASFFGFLSHFLLHKGFYVKI